MAPHARRPLADLALWLVALAAAAFLREYNAVRFGRPDDVEAIARVRRAADAVRLRAKS